jgi:hypothetical protein
MADLEQNLSSPAPNGDETLVTPRFDQTEARVAQPVVPLATVAHPRTRLWPLLMLSALLGGVVSIFGVYLYQRQRAVVNNAPPAAQASQPAAAPETPPPASVVAATPPVDEPAAPALNEETARVESKQTEERAAVEHAPARPAAVRQPEAAEPEQPKRSAAPARVAQPEPRPRRVAVIRDDVDAAVRPRADTTRAERNANPEPPRRRPRPRNVDRIRDIFEGTRPPA